jgi:hypothetical protein
MHKNTGWRTASGAVTGSAKRLTGYGGFNWLRLDGLTWTHRVCDAGDGVLMSA